MKLYISFKTDRSTTTITMNFLSKNHTVNQSPPSCNLLHCSIKESQTDSADFPVQENHANFIRTIIPHHTNTGLHSEPTTFALSNSCEFSYHVSPESVLPNNNRAMIINYNGDTLRQPSTTTSFISLPHKNAYLHSSMPSSKNENNFTLLSSPRQFQGSVDRGESCKIDNASAAKIPYDNILKNPFSLTHTNISASLCTQFEESDEKFSPRLLGGK